MEFVISPLTQTGLAALALLLLALLVMVRDYRQNRRFAALAAANERLLDERWELSEALERTRSLLDAQGDMVVARDVSGRIVHANDAFAALCGRQAVRIVGTDSWPVVVETGETSHAADGSCQFDQCIDMGGSLRWIAWRETMVRDAQTRQLMLAVGRDISDRIADSHSLSDARERAESASRSKSRFLAAMSHEIRTPVAGMLGMANLLADTPLQPDQRNYVQALKTSGESLIAIIGDILDFSKIEAGKLELEEHPFDLTALIESVTELLAPRAQAKQIELVADIDEMLPARVIGDATRLRQVLVNLVGNAVKFTEKGGVSLTLVAGQTEGTIAFTIADTGIGIEADALARIFSEFEQADNSISRKHGGTGLGLAISRRIVERMGGSLAVESVPGSGSQFSFVVKLIAEGPQIALDRPDLSAEPVLIVSPSPVLGPVLARRLRRWGAEAVHADSLEAAQDYLIQQRWTRMLVDRALGHEACQQLAQAEGIAAPARRILMLAPSERLELQELIEAGFDAYLVKPVRALSLATRLVEPAGTALAPDAEVEADDAPPSGVSVASTPATIAINILVAEDNPINAMLARALITNMGHRVVLAADGELAVAAFEQAVKDGAPFDLVLMDMQMPQVDGLEATRRIRAGEGPARRVPIHALTANAFPEDAEACRAVGMDGFLVKPLDKERLEELTKGLATTPVVHA